MFTKEASIKVREIAAEQRECEENLQMLYEYYNKTRKSKIEVGRYVFPGVNVCVNMEKLELKKSARRIQFMLKDNHLGIFKA